MKKIIAFIVLVILVIVMIVMSYNFYSNNNKSNNKNKLNSGLKVTTNKKIDNGIDSNKQNTDNNKQDTDNDDSSKTEDNNNLGEESDVPDTASDSDADYVVVDHYTVSVDKSTLKVGETSNIYVKVYPNNASEREVSYSSSDNKIVKVNSFGKMKALAKGEVRITVKVKNCNDYSFIVNVK